MKKPENLKAYVKYMPTAVFCLFIFAVMIMYIVIPDSDFSALEKRSLSDMPKPAVNTALDGSFGKDFETYLADQMPLRTFWVGTNAYYNLFSGRNGQNGVYKAKDDYLMAEPVRDNPLLEKNISYINEFIENVQIPSYVCIVPTSGYIYSNELPAVHYEYNDDDIIEKAHELFRETSEYTKFVDITDKFKELSADEQLYYKTDHHWTSLGAYECYKLLGKAMGFTPTNIRDFEIESHDGFYGTNYSKSALWFTPSESIELWKNTNHSGNSITVSLQDGEDVTVSNSMFFEENLNTQDQYTVFLGGNHAMVRIKNEQYSGDKKLLVLRDSYSHCIAPFLADNYSEIVLIDLRYYKDNVSELVKSEEIDQLLVLYSLDSIVNSTDIAYLF